MFQNDDATIDFLELHDKIPSRVHKAGFSIELNNVAYFDKNSKPFSHKNITIKNGSSSENHIAALLDPKIAKIKDESNGENLSEAPEDGRFGILPFSTNQERTSILVEETKEINLGTAKNPHIIHLAASLTPTEDPSFVEFFQQR